MSENHLIEFIEEVSKNPLEYLGEPDECYPTIVPAIFSKYFGTNYQIYLVGRIYNLVLKKDFKISKKLFISFLENNYGNNFPESRIKYLDGSYSFYLKCENSDRFYKGVIFETPCYGKKLERIFFYSEFSSRRMMLEREEVLKNRYETWKSKGLIKNNKIIDGKEIIYSKHSKYILNLIKNSDEIIGSVPFLKESKIYKALSKKSTCIIINKNGYENFAENISSNGNRGIINYFFRLKFGKDKKSGLLKFNGFEKLEDNFLILKKQNDNGEMISSVFYGDYDFTRLGKYKDFKCFHSFENETISYFENIWETLKNNSIEMESNELVRTFLQPLD